VTETARSAADLPLDAGPPAPPRDEVIAPDSGPAAAFAVPPPPPPPEDVPPPPPSVPFAAAAPGQLLYYAVWLPAPNGMPSGPPLYLPAGGAVPGAAAPPLPPMPHFPAMAGAPGAGGLAAGVPSAAAQHNQRILVWMIILGVIVVHVPWIAYLVAVHGCWGTFLDACWQTQVTDAQLLEQVDPFADTVGDPYLFARIVFLLLRVQTVLSADWAEYSQAMQLSTGLGSFVLTRIVASNGMVTEGRAKAIYLAAFCFTLFIVLFWAELHLTSDTVHPLLGDDTVLDYISQTLPPDFASYGSVRDGLMQLLQFLRLADALILGACLALPTTERKPA
jgi:hypothetical protein